MSRELSYCPDVVAAAYDKDVTQDSGFRVSCEAGQGLDLDYQDPGIPAQPLEVLKPGKAISSAARDTLRSSACFRLLTIAFFLVMKLAEDND